MSYLNKAWLTASVSIASLVLGIATFVGTCYLPEAQGLPLFVILGLPTIAFAIVGFLLGVESYRKTRNAQALIGLLVGGGMLMVIGSSGIAVEVTKCSVCFERACVAG